MEFNPLAGVRPELSAYAGLLNKLGFAITQEVASSLNIPGTILSKTRTNENGAKKFSIEERNGCLSTSEVSGGDRRQKQ